MLMNLAWNKAQGAKGGCDGSLILADGELSRGENKGLESISAYIKGLAGQYNVGVADLIGTSCFSVASLDRN